MINAIIEMIVGIKSDLNGRNYIFYLHSNNIK